MSRVIINNIKLFMNMHDSVPCGLISHLREASLFKCFMRDDIILKSIIFSHVYVNSKTGSCITCDNKKKNIADNVQQ